MLCSNNPLATSSPAIHSFLREPKTDKISYEENRMLPDSRTVVLEILKFTSNKIIFQKRYRKCGMLILIGSCLTMHGERIDKR